VSLLFHFSRAFDIDSAVDFPRVFERAGVVGLPCDVPSRSLMLADHSIDNHHHYHHYGRRRRH